MNDTREASISYNNTTANAGGGNAPLRSRVDRLVLAAMTGVSALVILYHLAMTQWQLQDSTDFYLLHGALMLGLVFATEITLEGKGSKKYRRWLGWFGLLGSIFIYVYFSLRHSTLIIEAPYISNADFLVGLFGISLFFSATWLAWGGLFPIVTFLMLVFAFFGQHIPEPFGHMGFEPRQLVSWLGAGLTHGMFGPMIQISADSVFLIVVFGALLTSTKIINGILDAGRYLGNVLRGGSAYGAVFGSGLMASVTGLAVANVALTGVATIPTMKKEGFTPAQAGAVEAVASTGAQILPPIMGAGAFLMAVYVGVPYFDIVKAALIPGLLYFIAVGLGVFFITRASGIGLNRQNAGDDLRVMVRVMVRALVRALPPFLIPMSVIVGLLVLRYTPGFASFWGIVAVFGVFVAWRESRPSLGELLRATRAAAILGAQLGVLLGLAGVLTQAAVTTGFGTRISQSLTQLLGDNLPIVLFVSALVTIVLGMGLPTPVAYVIAVVTVIPLLIDSGIDRLAAHFFGFYYASLSAITPPIAFAVIMATKISKAPFLETAGHALRLSTVLYLLPIAFVLHPNILYLAKFGVHEALILASSLLTSFGIAVVTYGYLARPLTLVERGVVCLAVVSAMFHIGGGSVVGLLIGASLLLAVGIWPRFKFMHGIAREGQVFGRREGGRARDYRD